jgi:hypothetical protein
MVGFHAPLGGGRLREETLKHPPRHPDHAAVLADLDPELHGLPLGIPLGVLGNDGWETAPLALFCSQPQLDEEQAPREAGDLTKRKDDNLICREGIERRAAS